MMPDHILGENSIVKAAPNQVSSDLGGEAVILDVETGTYFGLEEVGSLVWDLLQEPRRIGDLCAAVVAEYDVTMEQCKADLLDLLADLHSNGLIEVVDGALA